MTPASRALTDLLGILARDGSVLQRFQALEDRIHQWCRDEEAGVTCECGEPDCKRATVLDLVDDAPEAA